MSEIFSGSNITINNLAMNKAEITPIGGSWQETREGYNILDYNILINNYSFAYNKETGYYDGMPGNYNSTDILSFDNPEYLALYYEGDLEKALFLEVTYEDNSKNSYYPWTYENKYTYITPKRVKKVVASIASNIQTSFRMMISKSTVAKPFELYGVMPSPEFKSEIKNVSGNANITVCNQNFMPVDHFYGDETKKVNFNDFIPAGTYTLIYNLDKIVASSPNRAGFYIDFRGEDGSIRIFSGNMLATESLGRKFKTFTLNFDVNLMSTIVNNASSENYIRISDIQIVKGEYTSETLPNHILHQSQSYTFPLVEGQKLMKGDYLADDGIHHKRKQIVLDGTADGLRFINFESRYNNRGRLNKINNIKKGISYNENDALCSHFKYMPNVWFDANNEVGFVISEAGTTYIRFSNTSEIDTLEKANNWLVEQYANGTPFVLEYELAEEEIEPYTLLQENIYNQLQNVVLYNGINHIITISSLPDSEVKVIVKRTVEDYKIYISVEGYLVIPELNIKYLIDFNESSIPSMPEATEATVRAAGRDGDIVLSTTYEPMLFNIVCYTDDNLELSQKVEAERKINEFLNKIKNKTIEFAIEKDGKFYNVKYSGALTMINFPKHLKFSIPLKSSEAYGKELIKKSIIGTAQKESKTVHEVGALFIIRGPATHPIISLNDYSMEYNWNILEGARLEIDSNKSTITNINSSGVRTNAMRYYNHQFPKIENGMNQLKVLSGIKEETNVTVEWNDFKL